jgi:two-component system, cell cycle sensor histidine kinase and response regulator CckA
VTGDILIVEDSPRQAARLSHVLSEAGHRVTVAPDGERALATMAEHRPRLVITDIVMPGMDGYTLCRAIKDDERLSEIPVILLTSLSSPHDVLKGLGCGADNFIRKPYEEQYLLQRVSHILTNIELRKREKTRPGMEISFAGERHFINSERRQIVDFLISSFEEAVHLNGELTRSYRSLDSLYRIAEGLNRCTSEPEVTAEALERVLDLPGVQAAWILIRDGAGGSQLGGLRARPGVVVEPEAPPERHASVPLLAGNRLVGVMNLVGPDDGHFGDDDLRTLHAVGNQVAAALERALLQEQKMDSVGRLAGGIAHDFNNLMSAVIGFSELLLARMDAADPGRRHVHEIKRSGERAAALTQQLLAFGRRQVQRPEVLDLGVVVSDLQAMLRRLIGEDIDLLTVAAEDLWPVKMDRSHIEQVVMNLALNARDAMPTGGKLTIEAANRDLDEEFAASHFGVDAGAYVLLTVSDTGAGMDGDTRTRIFEPFFSTKEDGTGLGLSTVFGIVKQSGGDVTVYSEPGHGATFRIYLPRTDEVAPRRAPAGRAEPAGGSETVLVVEDEEGVRELVREILQQAGYKVLTAAGPAEALEVAEGGGEPEIELLITDMIMPEMSGRQVADRLRGGRPDMRVLYMSGYTGDAMVHRGLLDPDSAFMVKPFASRDLMATVREILDARV